MNEVIINRAIPYGTTIVSVEKLRELMKIAQFNFKPEKMTDADYNALTSKLSHIFGELENIVLLSDGEKDNDSH